MAGPLTENQMRLLSLFKKAIEGEDEAQTLYAEMRDRSEVPAMKSVFEQLILDERDHAESLRTRYAELRQTDDFKDAE